MVVAGAHDLRKSTSSMQLSRIKRKIVHELWNVKADSNHNDIALIEVATEFKFNEFVRPICLPSDDISDFPTGTKCITTGWGKTQGRFCSFVDLCNDHC